MPAVPFLHLKFTETLPQHLQDQQLQSQPCAVPRDANSSWFPYTHSRAPCGLSPWILEVFDSPHQPVTSCASRPSLSLHLESQNLIWGGGKAAHTWLSHTVFLRATTCAGTCQAVPLRAQLPNKFVVFVYSMALKGDRTDEVLFQAVTVPWSGQAWQGVQPLCSLGVQNLPGLGLRGVELNALLASHGHIPFPAWKSSDPEPKFPGKTGQGWLWFGGTGFCTRISAASHSASCSKSIQSI